MSWNASWPALSSGHIPPPPVNPFKPAPRFWKGNMCGVHVVGLPPVDGGASDSSLVLSWFYDRYQPASRTRIRAAWKAKGYTHVLLSWPDAVAALLPIATLLAPLKLLLLPRSAEEPIATLSFVDVAFNKD